MVTLPNPIRFEFQSAGFSQIHSRGPQPAFDRPPGDESIHRPLADLSGSGVNCRSTMMFHQEGTNAMMSEKQCRREAYKAAADDQDRHLDFIHGGHISKNGPSVASGVFF